MTQVIMSTENTHKFAAAATEALALMEAMGRWVPKQPDAITRDAIGIQDSLDKQADQLRLKNAKGAMLTRLEALVGKAGVNEAKLGALKGKLQVAEGSEITELLHEGEDLIAEVRASQGVEAGEMTPQEQIELARVNFDRHSKEAKDLLDPYFSDEEKERLEKLEKDLKAARASGNMEEERNINKEITQTYKDKGIELENSPNPVARQVAQDVKPIVQKLEQDNKALMIANEMQKDAASESKQLEADKAVNEITIDAGSARLRRLKALQAAKDESKDPTDIAANTQEKHEVGKLTPDVGSNGAKKPLQIG